MLKFNQINEEEILDEGLISGAFSVGMTLYIAKKLMTPWKMWDCYRLGLIDDHGQRINKQPETKEEKDSLSILNCFIMDLRKILLKFVSEAVLKVLVVTYLLKKRK